jgi:hypothetical protein
MAINRVIQRVEDEYGQPILDNNGREQYITLSETITEDIPEPTTSIDINSLTIEQLIELKKKLDSLSL